MNFAKIFSRLTLIPLLAIFSLPLLADDTVYTKVEVNPIPLKTPPPEYPADMKRQGVAGMVALSILIDESGTVIESSVSKSSRPEFEASALAAVKKWKFKPAQIGGNPVKMKFTVPLRFNLEE